MLKYYNNKKHLKSSEWVDTYTKEQFDHLKSEYKKCKEDIIYFAEKYYYILTEHGKKIINCFPKQRELVRYFQDNQLCVVLASRQIGKTTAYSIYITWKILFSKDVKILIVGNKATTAQGILSNIKDAIAMLPWDMKPGVVTWNKRSIELANGCEITTAATSPDAARSTMAHLLVVDEAAFIDPPELADAFWRSVSPIISSGQDTQVIMVSTPNGASGLFYETYEKARLGIGEFNWTPFRIDYWDRPGRDESWVKKQLALLNYDQVAFDQEYGNNFTGSSYTLVPGTVISEYKNFIIDETLGYIHPTVLTFPNMSETLTANVWHPPMSGRSYVIGVDVADGVGRDKSSISVWDVTNLKDIKQCAAMASNVMSTQEVSYVVAKFGLAYNNALVACEANSIGRAVVNDLLNVYEYENLVTYGGKLEGILSQGPIKASACRWLRTLLSDPLYNITVYDRFLIGEMEYFEKDMKSSTDIYKAFGKNHDDLMMSWIWAMFTLHEDLIEDYYEVDGVSISVLGNEIPLRLIGLNNDDDCGSLDMADGFCERYSNMSRGHVEPDDDSSWEDDWEYNGAFTKEDYKLVERHEKLEREEQQYWDDMRGSTERTPDRSFDNW